MNDIESNEGFPLEDARTILAIVMTVIIIVAIL